MGGIMGTRSHTSRIGLCQLALGVTKIAIGRFELGHAGASADEKSTGQCHCCTLVRDHEYAAVGAIFRAKAATYTMVLDHDLQVFPAVNGVHWTTHHAMRIG